MNKTLLLPAFSIGVLMLGVAACTPSKEDPPPKPKVTADARPTPAQAASPTPASPQASVQPQSSSAGTIAMELPKLGPAPAWRLQDLAGKLVASDEFKGKVVVVDFWATWCPPCRAEIPGYIQLQEKYGKDGFVIIGVSLDQAGAHVVKSFADKNAMNYPIVMGDDEVVAAFGGVEGIPTTFLIDRAGVVRDRKVGAEETAEYEKKIVAVLGEKS